MDAHRYCNIKKCLGIFQTFVAFLMLALGVVPAILWGKTRYLWTLQEVFIFVYLISAAVIGCILLFAGGRLIRISLSLDKSRDVDAYPYNSKTNELLIVIFNIIFILIHLSTVIVLEYKLFRFSAFIIYCLMMIPSVVLTVLAFLSLIAGKKNSKDNI